MAKQNLEDLSKGYGGDPGKHYSECDATKLPNGAQMSDKPPAIDVSTTDSSFSQHSKKSK